MKKTILLPVLSLFMVLALVVASCDTANDNGDLVINENAGQTITSGGNNSGGNTGGDNNGTGGVSDGPQYGGTLTVSLAVEPTFDLLQFGAAYPQMDAHEKLYEGDWTKGIAGGYGEALTDWGQSTNIPDLNTGYLASDYYWEVSEDGSEVTTHFTVREGVFFAQPDSEAGDLVDGREMTVDDIIWNLNLRIHDENAQNYQLYPLHRYPEAVKTGENSFSITHIYEDHIGALMRENCSTYVFAPELWDVYGYESCINWEYSVGTGPYMLTDYIVGNTVECTRNPDYWMTDPTGPGTGNQLPYIEKIKYIIIIDESTRQAALRSAKIDQISAFTPEDKDFMLNTTPELEYAERGTWSETPLFMNTLTAPFNDIRVRKAMMLATDFQGINEGLYSGIADIISWPYFNVKGYEPLFVSPDDPDLPADVKELYSYNPVKAKELLAEAGYPDGFKTTLFLQQSDIDYYSIIADQWAQVGIGIDMQPLEMGALLSTAATVGYSGLIAIFTSPNSSFPEQSLYASRNWVNASLINELYVDEQAEKIRSLAITDFQASMELCRPLIVHLLGQAYMIPAPRHTTYSLWWPWLKNYSGETSVGYFPGNSWAHWCWIDENLKAEMNH